MSCGSGERMRTEIIRLIATNATTSRKQDLRSTIIISRSPGRILFSHQPRETSGSTSQTTSLMTMCCGRKLQMQAVAVLALGLAFPAIPPRLAFALRGCSAAWATAAVAVSRAVSRTLRSVTRFGTAPSEHLVVRVKNGVNCAARGAVSPIVVFANAIIK